MHLSKRHSAHHRQELRQSTRILQAIRKSLNKLENELVTIEEFCQYAGLKIEQVEPLIFG